MTPFRLFSFIGLLFLLFPILSCSTKVDVNAPAKDIYVIYGILDASQTVQNIRISKGFLIEGDAIQYAKNTDLSVKGLKVELIAQNNATQIATQIDNVPTYPTNGEFYPYTTLYRFQTEGSTRLKKGERYRLKITNPNDVSMSFEAETTIPLTPQINTPNYTPVSITPAGEYTYSIPRLDLDKAILVTWESNFQDNSLLSGYEVRAYLYYQKDGVPDTVSFLSPFLKNGDGYNCSPETQKKMCYQFNSKELITKYRGKMTGNPGGSTYTYLETPNVGTYNELPKSFRFEVTAADSFYTKYTLANSPAYQDFNGVKPEYTNIKGTKEAYGVFGSINRNTYDNIHNGYAVFGNCAKYLLGLNNTPQPPSNCEL